MELDSENEAPPKNQFLKTPAKQAVIDDKDESSDDDDDWPSDSDTSSTSTDDDEGKYSGKYNRKRFLKTAGPDHEVEDEDKAIRKEEKRKERKEKERRKIKKEDEEDGEGEWETVRGGVAIPSVSFI